MTPQGFAATIAQAIVGLMRLPKRSRRNGEATDDQSREPDERPIIPVERLQVKQTIHLRCLDQEERERIVPIEITQEARVRSRLTRPPRRPP